MIAVAGQSKKAKAKRNKVIWLKGKCDSTFHHNHGFSQKMRLIITESSRANVLLSKGQFWISKFWELRTQRAPKTGKEKPFELEHPGIQLSP